MRKHQVRNDVAVSSEIDGLVEAVVQMDDIRAGGAVQLFRMIPILHDDVAHVLLTAAGSGDVPAAPAVLKSGILAGDEGCGFHYLGSR